MLSPAPEGSQNHVPALGTFDLVQPAGHLFLDVLSDKHILMTYDIAEKIDAPCLHGEYLVVPLQLEVQPFLYHDTHLSKYIMQVLLACSQNDNIIAIAEIVLHANLTFHVMIQQAKIKVSKQLA